MQTRRTSHSRRNGCVRPGGRVACMVVALAGTIGWAMPGYAERPKDHQQALRKATKAPEVKRTKGGKTIGAKSATIARLSPDSALQKVGPRPVITAEEPIHDFGEMWIGPVLKHTFKITNTGEMELKITKVKPACGCTIGGAYPRTLKPGETGEFPFSISTRKLRGKFAKSIAISTNDPATPTLRLQLRGKVKRYIDLSPLNIQLGKLYGKEPQKRVVKLTNNTDKMVELAIGTKPDGNFKLELVTTDPGKAFELHVTALPPFAPTGVFRKKITLTTNLPENPTVEIDMRGTVPPRLDIKPSAITMRATRPGAATAGRPSTRVVRLTNYGATPVKVTSASVDDPTLDVTVKEQKVGEAYNIQVKFPAGYELPAGGRLLTLKTDDPQRPTITVPIRTVGRRPSATAQRPAETLVGKPAPRFALKTLEGKSVSSADLKGNVTVLNFFAVNCGFCKRQIPRMEKVRATYAEKGVRFVAVSQTMRGKRFTDEEVKNKLDEMGFMGEIALDPNNNVGPLFKATSFPTMVVIGKTGKIDAVNVGNISDLETRLSGQLDALLAGKPIPATLLAKKPTATPKPTARKRPNDLIGKPAPAFATQTLGGKSVGNKDFASSTATILNFIATNCGFCKKQIPRLETLREKYTAKGVRFINVSQKMRKEFSQDEVVAKMKGLGFKGELVIDHTNKIGGLFNATGFPTMIVVGKTGKVEAVNVGNVGDLESRVSKQLDAIIAGKPVPKLAAAPSRSKKPRGGQVGDLIGKPAPAFSAKTVDGKELSNAEFAKHPATVLDFFALNCGFCKKQIPRVEKMRQKYADKGVRFVNVSQKMRTAFPQDKVVAQMKELGFKGELVIDHTNKIGGLFNARGFPTMIVVGRSGKVEAVNVGNPGDLEKRMDAQLTALIEGKPIPKFAGSAPPKRSNRRPAEDLVGKMAPSFALTTLKGNSFSNQDFSKHKATVLDFIAPNCGYCKRQLPGLEKVRADYESKGVRFLVVAQKMRKDFTEDEIVSILKKAGSNIEISTSDFAHNKIGRAYKAVSFPTLFVVDNKGKIAKVVVGAKQDLEKQLRDQLDILIKG